MPGHIRGLIHMNTVGATPFLLASMTADSELHLDFKTKVRVPGFR